MKTRVWITFRAEKVPGEAEAILVPTGCGSDVAKVSDYTVYADKRDITVDIKLDETDERVAKVFALLKHYGVEADTSTYIEHSNDDLQNARLLWMAADANVDVFAGLYYGTEYDLTNACPNCKTGAKQTSVLYIRNDDIKTIRKHRAMRCFDGEILVDGGMRKKLVEHAQP
jgi:hypothetical protein